MKLSVLIILLFTAPCLAQKPEVVIEYINNYQQYAIAEQLRTGIPAAITMAQAIHESGAGQGDLALKSNNHFGIKCKSNWTGDRVFHDDDSLGECFRAYNNVADSYRDHSDFLITGKRYSFLFDLDPTDYKNWANGLKQAGYATNPKYQQILQKIIEDNDLETLTETAMRQSANGNENIWLASSKTNTPAINNAPTRITENEAIVTPEKNKAEKKETIVASQQGIFKINHCRAVFVPTGSSLRKIAVQYGLTFNQLLAFNDIIATEKLVSNQVMFLEEKKKKGGNKVHEVQKGETSWLISQQEGLRLDKLLAYNRLASTTKLKAGQLLYLKGHAPK
ncbi:glucosaminidase domain-containing protein [soil metagenome]